jgi:hypothetical protein
MPEIKFQAPKSKFQTDLLLAKFGIWIFGFGISDQILFFRI